MAKWRKSMAALAGVAAALAAVAGWSYASPWMAMSSLQSAARSGDVAELNKLVDWGSVRDKLTIDLGRRALASGGLAPNDERVQEVVLAVEAQVDKMVTPDNTIALFREAQGNGDKLLIKGLYMGMGSYIFAIENQSRSSAITVVLKRQGPASWRVGEVILLDLSSGTGG